jgi:hypothetical protein
MLIDKLYVFLCLFSPHFFPANTLKEQDYMTETLSKMEENRDENKKLLKQKKSLIIKQISAAKSKVLKYLDVCVYFTVYFVFFWTNCFHDESTSRNIMTLIIYKKNLNISNKKNQYYNLEMSLCDFLFLFIYVLFLQAFTPRV